MQEPQTLCRRLCYKKIDAGHIAAGLSEAGDKTKLDRVYTFREDDWDRRRCSFRRQRNMWGADRGDCGHLAADQIAYQRRQAIIGLANQWYSTVTFWPST